MLLFTLVDRMEQITKQRNVAIITFGIHKPVGKALHASILKRPDKFHPPLDARRFMYRDPRHGKRYKVEHDKDADWKCTQLSLLDDPRFFDAVRAFVSNIEVGDNTKIHSVY